MPKTRKPMMLAPVLIAVLCEAPPAHAGTIMLLGQERSVSGSTFIDGCTDGPPFQSDSEMSEAPDADPFDSFVVALNTCDQAVSVAYACQDSHIDTTRIVSSLDAHTEAYPDPHHVVFALVMSIF